MLSLGAGRAQLRAEIALTSTGLLSIAALVSAVLLSTAVLVRAAGGGAAHADPAQPRR